MTIQLSVVVPSYQRRDLLQDMLCALANQAFPAEAFEVIVVVDGSPDDTLEMLRNSRQPYALRPVDQKQAGPSAARNHGARLAQGPVLLFLDDDLLPQPQLLNEHMHVHREDAAAVVLGRLLAASGAGHPKKGGWNVWEERILERFYRSMERGERVPAGRRLYSGNFSVRRERFLEVGGFDEQMKRGEDVELGYRLEAHGARFYFRSQAAAVHRGFRSFESWCRSTVQYGRAEVLLVREKRWRSMHEALSWHRRQHAVARAVELACLDRPRLRRLATEGLKGWGAAMTTLNLDSLAHPAYGAIYKLHYWQGFTDELGGRKAFLRGLRAL